MLFEEVHTLPLLAQILGLQKCRRHWASEDVLIPLSLHL